MSELYVSIQHTSGAWKHTLSVELHGSDYFDTAAEALTTIAKAVPEDIVTAVARARYCDERIRDRFPLHSRATKIEHAHKPGIAEIFQHA